MSKFIGSDEQFFNALDELIVRGGTAGAIAEESKERLETLSMALKPFAELPIPDKGRYFVELLVCGPNDSPTKEEGGTKHYDQYIRVAREALSKAPDGAAPPIAKVVSSLLESCRTMADDYQTSETHHPNHVLVPRKAFETMKSSITTSNPSTPNEKLKQLQFWVYEKKISLLLTDKDYFVKHNLYKEIGTEIRELLNESRT